MLWLEIAAQVAITGGGIYGIGSGVHQLWKMAQQSEPAPLPANLPLPAAIPINHHPDAFWLYPDWSGGDNLRDAGTKPFWMLPPKKAAGERRSLLKRPEKVGQARTISVMPKGSGLEVRHLTAGTYVTNISCSISTDGTTIQRYEAGEPIAIAADCEAQIAYMPGCTFMLTPHPHPLN